MAAAAAAATPTEGFFRNMGLHSPIPASATTSSFHAALIRALLTVRTVDPGRVVCSFTVNPAMTNPYNTLHGGAVAAVAEVVGEACARTVVGEKEVFLGELGTAYLSAGRLHAEMEVDACILRQGRSVIVVSVDIRVKETKKLSYTSRATFYIMPVASL